MTEDFKKFLREFIYPHEAAYRKGHYGDLNYVVFEDVKGDAGGVTKWGIDVASHRSLGEQGIKNLTIEQADEIYWKEFQDGGCDKLSYPLSYAYFDCQVNAGAGRARKLLIQSGNDAKKFCDARENFYHSLANHNPKLKKFEKGWVQRVIDIRKYLKLS